MTSVSGTDLARAVQRKGRELLRIRGSHHILGQKASIVRLSIPVHGNQPLKTGLLGDLMRLAGLSGHDL